MNRKIDRSLHKKVISAIMFTFKKINLKHTQIQQGTVEHGYIQPCIVYIEMTPCIIICHCASQICHVQVKYHIYKYTVNVDLMQNSTKKLHQTEHIFIKKHYQQISVTQIYYTAIELTDDKEEESGKDNTWKIIEVCCDVRLSV